MVCPTYPPNDVPCGVGDFTYELASRLAGSDLSLTVVASTSHHPVVDSPVRVIPLTDRWDRRAASSLLRMIRREAFDIVHIQYTPELYGRLPWMKLIPAALATRGGPPVILTAHTLVGGYPSAKALAPLLVGFSRRIICPNDEVTYLVSRYLPFLRRRIRPIPIGPSIPGPSEVPEFTTAAIRTEFGIGADTVVLSHFGFAYQGKGIEMLLAAATHLRDAGIKYRLLMIGGPWPGATAYYEQLQATSRKAGLDEYVVWLGRCDRERVASLLSASDVYVVPYDDGISTRRSTLLAGILHRLPILSTYPARPSHWFRDGENVVLVPPRDPVALARGLTTLITAPELRERLRLGVRDLAGRFSWPGIVAATAAVYREVCP